MENKIISDKLKQIIQEFGFEVLKQNQKYEQPCMGIRTNFPIRDIGLLALAVGEEKDESLSSELADILDGAFYDEKRGGVNYVCFKRYWEKPLSKKR